MNIRVGNKRRGAVGEYVGRPSPLGNPFMVDVHGDREQVIFLFESWLRPRLQEDTVQRREMVRLLELAGRGDLTLVCWCSPRPCHAEVIAKILREAGAK